MCADGQYPPSASASRAFKYVPQGMMCACLARIRYSKLRKAVGVTEYLQIKRQSPYSVKWKVLTIRCLQDYVQSLSIGHILLIYVYTITSISRTIVQIPSSVFFDCTQRLSPMVVPNDCPHLMRTHDQPPRLPFVYASPLFRPISGFSGGCVHGNCA